MSRTLTAVATAALLLTTLPAFAYDDRDRDQSPRSREDREFDDILHEMGPGHGGMSRARGTAFFLRQGDATIAVRCSPQESMKACVEATTTLMERAKTAASSSGSSSSSTTASPTSR